MLSCYNCSRSFFSSLPNNKLWTVSNRKHLETTILNSAVMMVIVCNESFENTCVAFVKEANERNETFEKINKQ